MTATVLLAEACGFPDVTFVDPSLAEAGSDSADARSQPPIDGAVPYDGPREAQVNPDVDPDGGAQDAASAGDAAKIDASGCTTCDCDGDGFNRIELPACDGGPGGKLPDCDDLNPAIHPGLGFISSPWPSSSTSHMPEGDWDCSGDTTRQLPYGANCAALSACTDGFVGNPPCGGTADYITCQTFLLPLGVTCSEKAREKAGARTQACH